MSKKEKIPGLNREQILKHINIGTIILFVIIIYILFYVISYLGKSKLANYQVGESDIVDSIDGTGILLRDEDLVRTKKNGYVHFFVRDGSRVNKGGMVYTIDKTGAVQEFLQAKVDDGQTLSDEARDSIVSSLDSYCEGYEDNAFTDTYDLHKDVSYDLASYTDTILADNLKKIKKKIRKKYGKKSFKICKAEETGLVTFSSDGLENLTLKTVTPDLFAVRARMEDLRSNEKLKKDTPVYRLVKGQRWRLAVPVSKEQYTHLKALKKDGKGSHQVTFKKDNFVASAPYNCKKVGEDYYVVLLFNDYIQRYADQRYLYVELVLSQSIGLKIPTSALVQKDDFEIPRYLLSAGGNSDQKNQVNVLGENKKGEKTLQQVEVSVYNKDEDEENVYVASDKLKEGVILTDLEMTETFSLDKTTALQGVYIINRGFTVFRPVVILERNQDYCIVDKDKSDIALYDRLILDSSSVDEGHIIY